VAHDDHFIRSSLEKTIAVDDFTGRLFRIYDTVMKEGVTQVASTANKFLNPEIN
jgi:glutathione synthase